MSVSASDDDDGAGGVPVLEEPIKNIVNHLSPDEEDNKYLGEVKSHIVGIRYYNGKVSNNDMVALVREPDNKFDPDAVKVLNMASQKVGYIKRQHAAALAIIMDKSLARVEGTIPYGADFYYQTPIHILLWGSTEKKEEVQTIIKSHGMSLRPTQNLFRNNVAYSNTSMSMSQGLQYMPSGATQDLFRNNGSCFNASTSMSQGLQYMPSGATQDLFRNNGSCSNASTSMSQGLQYMPSGATQNLFRNNGSCSNASTSMSQGLQYMPSGATQDLFRNNGSCSNASTSMSQGLQYMPSGATQDLFRNNGSCSNASTSMSQGLPNFLTPQEMQSEFGKIFETLDEGDKRAETEPAAAVSTVLFPYQKQALNWMISKENTDTLPPFWETLNECYWNTLAMFISITEPNCVHGGILADDMGLGKTLEMISLILYNFVDGKPLAYPLQGTCRLPFGSETMVSPKSNTTSVSNSDRTTVAQNSLQANTNFHNKFSLCLKAKSEERSVRTPRAPRLMIPGKKHENPEPRSSEVHADTITAESSNRATSSMKRSVQDAYDDIADDELPDIISPSELNKKFKAELPTDCDLTTGRSLTLSPRGTLIICPLSVVTQWVDQFEGHVNKTVHILLYVYHGPKRIKDVAFLKNQDVVITTYSTLTSDFKKSLTSGFNSSPLHKVKWLRIVLDEGHIIRNPSAQQTMAVYELKARRRWILTGTPIQNSITDFWSMLNFLQVQPFTDESLWDDVIAKPLCSGEMSAVQKVADLMRSLALRRTKNTKYNGRPLIDLPTRTVKLKKITLSKKERDLYEAMETKGQILIRRYAQRNILLYHYGKVLSILMRLRQLCCHPKLVAKALNTMNESDSDDNKHMDHLMSVLLSGSDVECTICLKSLYDPVITPCAHVYCRLCIEPVLLEAKKHVQCPLCCANLKNAQLITAPHLLNHSDNTEWVDSDDQWQSSTKVDALMGALNSLRREDPGIKSLVVSQFTSFLTILEEPLSLQGFKYCRFDGSLRDTQRTEVLRDFSQTYAGSPTVLLLSLNAGGVGINLTAASRVFLMDPAWNPAAEDQCFDRCHRIGQTKNVITTKFIVEDSIEERMIELQEKKRQLMHIAFHKGCLGEQNRTMRINEIKTLFNLN